MTHEHKLAIFRGRWKFKSNIQKIWGVLFLLTVVTAVEVVLGIYKPDIFMHTWMDPLKVVSLPHWAILYYLQLYI